MEHLFVYGSLRPGEKHHEMLASIKGNWQDAIVRGKFFPQGLEITEGYPAMIPDKHGIEIRGALFSSAYLPEHWKDLDDFEGDAYERRKVLVELVDGNKIDAWTYTLRKPYGDY